MAAGSWQNLVGALPLVGNLALDRTSSRGQVLLPHQAAKLLSLGGRKELLSLTIDPKVQKGIDDNPRRRIILVIQGRIFIPLLLSWRHVVVSFACGADFIALIFQGWLSRGAFASLLARKVLSGKEQDVYTRHGSMRFFFWRIHHERCIN
jgi:hypothetical protein